MSSSWEYEFSNRVSLYQTKLRFVLTLPGEETGMP